MAMRPGSNRELKKLAHQALTRSGAAALKALTRMGFDDPQRALQTLDRLTGSAAGSIALSAGVLLAAVKTSRPDRGLHHLERLVEAMDSGPSLLACLSADPALQQRLLQVLSHSRFLTEILVRNPQFLLQVLAETESLSKSPDQNSLRGRLRREMEGASSTEDRLNALRRAQRRELLRLGAVEILGARDVEEVGRELSNLADAVLKVVLELAMAEMVGRYGRPRDDRGRVAKFCIVCLGKHGGRELNFRSDIDLMFVYDGDGRTRPGRRGAGIDNKEFFQRLGERIIQILSASTLEGSLYPVDMRLRPEGKTGLLVRSLRSYWIYYETRGETWERQMLIKARCAAGSRPLWKRFRDMLARFIYPAHFGISPRHEIRQIKERIEARILERPARDNNIKLRAGGIRDIEFILQCLQLLNGCVNPQVRTQGTLEAISALRKAGGLASSEADSLEAAYKFYRRLENLLQIEAGRSAYALPEGRAEQAGLAKILGLPGAEDLSAAVDGHLKRVRAIFDGFFYGDEVPVQGLNWLLEAEPGSLRARKALQERGFADGTAAHRNLLQLSNAGMLTSTARQHLEELLTELVVSLAAEPDPDQGLVRFTQMVAAYGAPGPLFELLHTHAGFRRLLLAICGTSRFLAELIQRDPGFLDGLVTPDIDVRAGERADWRREQGAIQRHRNQELLRIGTDDLLGLTSQEETFLRLSDLAEDILGAAYVLCRRRLVQRHGKPRNRRGEEVECVCIAGGKFGGREMDFGADLDVFFVYAGEGRTGRTGTANSAFFSELVQKIIQLLQDGGLYKVDPRLRPEGRNAPAALSLAAYRRYLKGRAATWERLALTRARRVAGDPELGERVQRAIQRFVFRAPVDQSLADETVDLRLRMEPPAVRGRALQVDIKRGTGGIVDIEFIAQFGVLHWGRKHRELRRTSTRRILSQLMAMQYLGDREGRFLLDAYERLRGIEKCMRISSEQAPNVLPRGRDLELLARAAGRRNPGELEEEVRTLMHETRDIFTRKIGDFARREGRP